MGQSLRLPDIAATEALGASLAGALPADAGGLTILLEGELGAGKTSVARAMLEALGHRGKVPSPSYTLVEPYEFPRYTIYHIDLYRIESPEELDFLGYADLAEGVKIIEWPERVPYLGEEADIRLVLRYAGDGREAEFSALSDRGRPVVDAATAALSEELS